MDYLKNHCWCSDSNWGGNYNCQIIVSLQSYGHDEGDWLAIMEPTKIPDVEAYEWSKKYFEEEGLPTERLDQSKYYKRIYRPKQHVMDWLEANVPDDRNGKKMWCIGSDEYLASGSSCSTSFFFQRRRDAMAFIKEFSEYKKPVFYTQYFTDVRRELNLETMKYEDR